MVKVNPKHTKPKKKKKKKVLVNIDDLKAFKPGVKVSGPYDKTPPFALQNVVATFNIGIDRVD